MATALTGSALPAFAQESETSSDLADLSVEQLMNLEVTSVSKRPEKLSDAAAAIYVVTQEDIRRSGLTSVPDLLRLVPGMSVVQTNAYQWEITSRGFSGSSANKLLVLIDGRSVYSPMFSGVFWEMQDLPIDDIERIEVIRGPGSTLWGANAVNGVINIITKDSKATQGAFLSARGGTDNTAEVTARYGGAIGDDAHFRLFAQRQTNGSSATSAGVDASDAWHRNTIGFRGDWSPTVADSFMMEGQYLKLNADVSSAQSQSGSSSGRLGENTHILAKWDHGFSDDSDLAIQVYFDRDTLSMPSAGFAINTYDFDMQHRFHWGTRQEIVWGTAYRQVDDHTPPGLALGVVPLNRNTHIASGFMQDDILLSDSVHLIAGTKVEHNSYTNFEFEPSLRLSWAMTPARSLWAAFSRAIRMPTRMEEDTYATLQTTPGNPPTVAMILGNSDLKSEEELSWEIGYRESFTPSMSVDGSIFYNHYNNLITTTNGTPYLVSGSSPYYVMPTNYANQGSANTYGAEMLGNWQATSDWRLSASYTLLLVNTSQQSSSTLGISNSVDNTPKHQFQIHSYLNLPSNFEFDTALYYTGAIKSTGASDHTRLDMRLGWKPVEWLEVSLTGQNLLEKGHVESPGVNGNSVEVPRSVFLQTNFRF
jgi:iron complex outermembrane receptor protein